MHRVRLPCRIFFLLAFAAGPAMAGVASPGPPTEAAANQVIAASSIATPHQTTGVILFCAGVLGVLLARTPRRAVQRAASRR